VFLAQPLLYFCQPLCSLGIATAAGAENLAAAVVNNVWLYVETM